MTLTPQQEQELHRCMMEGLIHALYRTQRLTDAQFRDLMEDTCKLHAKAPPV